MKECLFVGVVDFIVVLKMSWKLCNFWKRGSNLILVGSGSFVDLLASDDVQRTGRILTVFIMKTMFFCRF